LIQRGEIWWASLPVPRGSEPGFRRPILVIQSDRFNLSRIKTVMAVALTTNVRLAEAPGNVLLTAGDTGLPEDSVANVSQIITVDKSFFDELVGSLKPRLLARVEAGLRLSLAL